MMSKMLVDLQDSMQDYLLGRDERVLSRIESAPTMSAKQRLDIYHYAYRVRLIDALADIYERVLYYLGGELFEKIAGNYVEGNPSATRNLRDYGLSFPEFLAKQFVDEPVIAELAKMDQCLRYTFDGVDSATLSSSDLAAIQPEQWESVVFQLHPTASFQTFRFNTPAIWQSVRDEETPPSIEESRVPSTWLFWRKDLQPHFRSLSEYEHAALIGVDEGRSFGEICNFLTEQFPEEDLMPAIASWLRTWLDDGMLKFVDYRMSTSLI